MSGEAGTGLTGSGAEPLEDEDPSRIGPIPLLGRLGAGGMGRVYLGVHEGRYAAVKQVLPSVAGEDKEFLRRFGHELDNLARLPDGATAPLLAGDRDARPPWFATAYVPGITLREAVDLHGPLPAEALWLILREAATALAAVHALDMVHRDLKPSNVMLTLDGLTLIDFGVARAAEQSQLTRTGMVVGTPAYMSPEQASGKRASSGVVDVFALGSVLAYAASGRPPFGDESGHAVLYRIVHEEPDLQPLRDLDPELADVVASCLDKDHEGRPSAAELVEHAAGRGPSAASPWPEDITGRLSERAAFAARVPEPVPLPEADEPEEPGEPDQQGGQGEGREAVPAAPSVPVVTGGPPEKRERRARTKVLALVIPVAVTGATLGFTLLPYVMDDDRDGNAAAPPTATATAAPGPVGSATGSTGPSASASRSPDGGKKDGKDKGDDKDKGKGEGEESGKGGGSGDAEQGASGGGSDSGGASGSGGSSGAGGSSGTGTSDSGASSGSDASAGSGSGSGEGGADDDSEGGGSASGSFMLKNGSSGKCMYVGMPIDDGACSGDSAVFRFQSTSDGAFRMLNVGTAQCIHSRSANAWLVKDACGSFGGEWREEANGSLRNLNTGGCLDLNRRASRIGLTTTTCTGSASQRWTRI
ncbi:serine/threonine-protein kinase [Streptomyces coelicoflavus]|uniref:non-specific serine/threonine protein kinase n=1 Tax=Streptomyces coelicoflavus TaxID=285562 RepID=A0A6N9UXK5_9ACTN|nr:serine/threonine-protein kinase [Streptomyces coelicoflavus]NEB20910.1 protein kinase [Streptomyces coelicoflavus]